ERLPQIEQVFIAGDGLSDQDMAIKLFTSRRRSSVANAADTDHHVALAHVGVCYHLVHAFDRRQREAVAGQGFQFGL
ncbi:hypothetical protein, partial [Klebsiella pneumoniae]|uniref:hypothetical protein n=1 Tax=Klebsiella pneumoniae TaxID=573 RepID=UPI0039C08755